MSTNINISVGDNKLLDQARLQQNASRQAQLEKEANKRLEAQATDARTKANAAQGKDANGNALYGVPSAKPDIDRRPAANRSGDPFDIGHCWVLTKNTTSQTTYQRWIDFETFIPVGSTLARGVSRVREEPYNHIAKSSFLCGSGNIGFDLELPIDNYSPPIPGENNFANICTYNDTVNNKIYRVASMKVITATSVNWGFVYFMLPVGKDSYILVQQGSSMYGQSIGTHNFWNVEEPPGTFPAETDFGFPRYWGQNVNFSTCTVPTATGYAAHEIKTNFALQRKAFICNNTSVREINMPSTLLAILQSQYPDPSIVSYGTNAYRSVTYQKNYYSVPFGSGQSNFIWNSSSLLSAGVAATIYTPEIYDILNYYGQYTNTIKPAPTGVRWRIADMSTGGYSIYNTGSYSPPYITNKVSELYDNGNSLYYTSWPNKDEAPDFRTFDSYWANLNLPKPKPGKSKLTFSPTRPIQTYQEGEEIKLGCVYDWNDPAYCHQQALALGFTTADLTP